MKKQKLFELRDLVRRGDLVLNVTQVLPFFEKLNSLFLRFFNRQRKLALIQYVNIKQTRPVHYRRKVHGHFEKKSGIQKCLFQKTRKLSIDSVS